MKYNKDVDEEGLITIAIDFVSVLLKVSPVNQEYSSKSILDTSNELGHDLATGEMPLAQAAIIYALRIGVFRNLSESGQRKLLDNLKILLASVLGDHVPIAVTSLECTLYFFKKQNIFIYNF